MSPKEEAIVSLHAVAKRSMEPGKQTMMVDKKEVLSSFRYSHKILNYLNDFNFSGQERKPICTVKRHLQHFKNEMEESECQREETL